MIIPALCASTLSLERVKARMTKTRAILNPSRNFISALVWVCFVYLITTIKLSNLWKGQWNHQQHVL